jgi:hypothetical protein
MVPPMGIIAIAYGFAMKLVLDGKIDVPDTWMIKRKSS